METDKYSSIANYVQSLLGKDIQVKLINGEEFVGNFITIDSRFYILMQNIRELKTDKVYKNMLIRGNMVLYITPVTKADSEEPANHEES